MVPDWLAQFDFWAASELQLFGEHNIACSFHTQQQHNVRSIQAYKCTIGRSPLVCFYSNEQLTQLANADINRKIPWRLSKFQKARQRKRLRAVDAVVACVDNALAKKGIVTKAVERWKEDMPVEQEMVPRDKYTIFDRKEKKYRKSIRSEFMVQKGGYGMALIHLQSCRNGRECHNESTLQDTDRLDGFVGGGCWQGAIVSYEKNIGWRLGMDVHQKRRNFSAVMSIQFRKEHASSGILIPYQAFPRLLITPCKPQTNTVHYLPFPYSSSSFIRSAWMARPRPPLPSSYSSRYSSRTWPPDFPLPYCLPS